MDKTKKSGMRRSKDEHEIFERIAPEACRKTYYKKKSTITFREIQAALRYLLTGKLGENAAS